jgi:hypothetical protein
MKRYTIGNLLLELEDEGSRRCVDWSGEIDAPDPAPSLSPVLNELVGELAGAYVDLRFDKLRYMNSASLTPIMTFLRDLSAVAKHVSVQYRGDVEWQNSSFRAVRVVARKWSNVEVVGMSSVSQD